MPIFDRKSIPLPCLVLLFSLLILPDARIAPASPGFEFESVRLLMPLDEARALADQKGWKLFIPARPSKILQLATLRPEKTEVERYDLTFEDFILTGFVVRYRNSNPKRAFLREQYPC